MATIKKRIVKKKAHVNEADRLLEMANETYQKLLVKRRKERKVSPERIAELSHVIIGPGQ